MRLWLQACLWVYSSGTKCKSLFQLLVYILYQTSNIYMNTVRTRTTMLLRGFELSEISYGKQTMSFLKKLLDLLLTCLGYRMWSDWSRGLVKRKWVLWKGPAMLVTRQEGSSWKVSEGTLIQSQSTRDLDDVIAASGQSDEQKGWLMKTFQVSSEMVLAGAGK